MEDCIVRKYGCSCQPGECRMEQHAEVASPARNWAYLLVSFVMLWALLMSGFALGRFVGSLL